MRIPSLGVATAGHGCALALALALAAAAAACGGGGGCGETPRGAERSEEATGSAAPWQADDGTGGEPEARDPALMGPGADTLDGVADALDDASDEAAGTAVAEPGAGCVGLGAEVIVWAQGGPAAVAPAGNGFLVVGYAPEGSGGETLFLARVTKGARTATPVTRAAVEPPLVKTERRAPPALLVEGGRAWVARVDGAGKLGVAKVAHRQPGAPLSFETVADGVDVRFAPALARVGESTLVAWVDGRGTPMRVRVAKLGRNGRVAARHDVTLEAMGGTAPAFVRGAAPPELVFVDARAGMSPLLHVRFDGGGVPGPTRVARTVGQVPEPPAVAAVRVRDEAWAAYTAVGSGATAAVGLVPLGEGGATPVPLVKGEAYGRLAVAAAAWPAGAAFVTQSPLPTSNADADTRWRLQVHGVDANGGLGAAWVIEDETATPGAPAIAALPDGTVAVVWSSGAVRVTLGQCGRG